MNGQVGAPFWSGAVLTQFLGSSPACVAGENRATQPFKCQP